jgi:hypothetical protein
MKKGRNYEGLYGKTKAEKMKKQRSIAMAKYNKANRGKTWEELYGIREALMKKYKFSKNGENMWKNPIYREKTCKKMLGIKKDFTSNQRKFLALKMKELAKRKKGKTWEELYGVKRAKEMSKKAKRRRLTMAQKNHLRKVNIGVRPSMKTKQKMSMSRIGKTWIILYGENEAKKKRIKLSLKKLGKNNHFYLNGKSKLPYPIKWCPSMKKDILVRDKKCAICGISDKKHKIIFHRHLDVHHIDGDKDNLNDFNLISLCKFHHSKIFLIQYCLQDHFHAKILRLI